MSLLGLLNSSMDLYTGVSVQDAYGGKTVTYTKGFSYPCRIRVLTAREQLNNGQMAPYVSHRIYCEATCPIAYANRVVIGTVTYEVTVNPNDVDLMGRHIEADVLRI